MYFRAKNADFSTKKAITTIMELEIVKYVIVLVAILKKLKYFTFEAG